MKTLDLRSDPIIVLLRAHETSWLVEEVLVVTVVEVRTNLNAAVIRSLLFDL